MITTANEFETIPAFTSIAGSTMGGYKPREITCDLLSTLQTASNYDTLKLWREIAECFDDDSDTMNDIQAEIAGLITENCPLPDYCAVYLQDGEWLVMPYLDGDLPRLEDIPDDLATIDGQTAYDILVVNDHGNVSFMQWDDQQREYVTQWATV